MSSSASRAGIGKSWAALELLFASATLCSGCGAPESSQPTTRAESASELLLCSTPNGGGTPEYYVLPAIRAKLRYYPEFARAIDVDDVSDCEGARAYMRAYRSYSDSHPSFDIDQPLGELTPAPELPQGPLPELDTPKILNGVDRFPGGYPENPVVRLTTRDLLGTSECSGTFIAKNWITTAAHCLAVVSADGAPLGDPPFPFTTTPLPGNHSPAARLWGYAKWTVEWADVAGNPAIDLRATLNSGTNDVLQYPDPRYQGGGGLDTNNDTPNDFALLYFDKDLYDRLLPPRADTGAAMRIAVRAPTATDTVAIAGYGGETTPALTAGTIPAQDQRILGDARIFSLVPSFTNEPVLCKGDSGGPLYRTVNVGLLNAPVMAPVLVGVASSFSRGAVSDCALPGDTEKWRRVETELDFIETAMKIWNGDGFFCEQKAVAGGLDLDYAECWGAPCGGPTGLTCGTNPPEFCSRPGEDLAIVSDCPTCAGDSSCGCVVGQCLRSPPDGSTP